MNFARMATQERGITLGGQLMTTGVSIFCLKKT